MASPPLRDKPNVLSIPAGVSFADTLAAELLREAAGDPLKLAEMTVLLPNRRACRYSARDRRAEAPHAAGAPHHGSAGPRWPARRHHPPGPGRAAGGGAG